MTHQHDLLEGSLHQGQRLACEPFYPCMIDAKILDMKLFEPRIFYNLCHARALVKTIDARYVCCAVLSFVVIHDDQKLATALAQLCEKHPELRDALGGQAHRNAP